MNKLIIIFIGVALLITGGVIFTIGVINRPSKPLEEKEYYIEEAFNNFDFQIETGDLLFVKSSDATPKVVVEENEDEYYEVSVESNTLVIKSVTKKWYERITFFNFGKRKITVYLPQTEFDSFNLTSSTGDINMPSDFTFNTFTANVSTGDIEFSSKVTGLLKITTSTGDQNIKNTTLGSLELVSSTGKKNIENVQTSTMTFSGSTGNLNISNTTASTLTYAGSTSKVVLKDTIFSGDVKIKTGTGDVKLDKVDAANFDITTDTGDIRGTILLPKFFDVDSDTGKENVPKTKAEGNFIARSDTGDIVISIAE